MHGIVFYYIDYCIEQVEVLPYPKHGYRRMPSPVRSPCKQKQRNRTAVKNTIQTKIIPKRTTGNQTKYLIPGCSVPGTNNSVPGTKNTAAAKHKKIMETAAVWKTAENQKGPWLA